MSYPQNYYSKPKLRALVNTKFHSDSMVVINKIKYVMTKHLFIFGVIYKFKFLRNCYVE